MAESNVIEMTDREPVSVTIRAASAVRFTPNELRALKEETGRSFTELMGPEADDVDRMQALAWLRLRREGRPLDWEACGDVAIELTVDEQPDPFTSGR